jgi:zinc protease
MTAARIPLAAVLCAALAVFAPDAWSGVPVPEPTAPARHLPAPVERTLSNGLRVVVFPAPGLPIVHVQLLVPAGSAAETAGQEGVAPLTLALLRQGTASRTPGEMVADFAQLGTTLVTSGTRDYALVACGARSEALEGVLELMSDAVLSPMFGGDDFAAARDAEVRAAEMTRGSLADAADAWLAAEVYGAHPYAHDPEGNPRALASVELPMVHAFYRDHWRPDRSVLVIAGAVTADRAFTAAADWFDRWAGHAVPARALPVTRPAAGVRVFDVPGAANAEVRVAVLGPGLASPEHDAWALATGAFENSRLPAGARARVEGGRDASVLVLSASAPVTQAAATAQALVRSLQAFVAAPPEGEALAALRRRAAQRYPLTIGTLGAFTSQWQALDNAGAPAGAIADFGTRESAADLGAGLRLLAAPPVVLVAGRAATVRAPLESAGLGAVRVVSASGEGPSAQEDAAPVTPEMRQRGAAAVAAAVTAHGGSAAMQAMKTLVTEGTITMRINAQQMTGEFSVARKDPDRFSFATKFMNMETRQLCRGEKGWVFVKSDTILVRDLDSLGLRQLRASAASDLVHELRMASAPGADPLWRGTADFEGRPHDLVEYSTPFGRHRLAIDPATHQVSELASGRGPRGAWADRRSLSDFRRVNGLLLPWVEERAVPGEGMWRMTATEMAVGREIPESLFDRPTAP